MAEKLDRQKLIETIYKTRGKVTYVARAMGCSRQTIYNYRDKYKTVANALEDAAVDFDVELLDLAESKLRASVLDGESWAIKYVLDTKGLTRGYRRGVDVTSDGGPLQLNIVGVVDDDDVD